MATEMITVKLDDKFLEDIDSVVKKEGYQNRTEFIRAALREKVDDVKLKKAMIEIAHLRGKAPKKTTDEEREKIRKRVFEEFDKKFR